MPFSVLRHLEISSRAVCEYGIDGCAVLGSGIFGSAGKFGASGGKVVAQPVTLSASVSSIIAGQLGLSLCGICGLRCE